MPGSMVESLESPRPLGLEGVSSGGLARKTKVRTHELGQQGALEKLTFSHKSEQTGLYHWGINGHDLASIHADQRDHYYSVMTTTAVPATGLDLGDCFRGPTDTILEGVPGAVLYEH